MNIKKKLLIYVWVFFFNEQEAETQKGYTKNETKNDKQYCGQIEINEKKTYYKKT